MIMGSFKSSLPVSRFIERSQGPGCREQGSVLVISLLILLIMSLLSITSLNNSVLEEKMAANSRNNQGAFQVAEAALRQAENFIRVNMALNTDTNSGNVADTSCLNGLCDCDNRIGGAGFSGCPFEYWSNNDLPAGSNNPVWQSPGNYKDYVPSIPVSNNAAKFIIEYMGKTQAVPPAALVPDPRVCPTCPDMYRITALGENVNSGARVMLQSTYRKN